MSVCFGHRSTIKNIFCTKHPLVDRITGLFLGMFTHSAHGGEPPVSNLSRQFRYLAKTAVFCGFWHGYLRIVKDFSSIINGKRGVSSRCLVPSFFLCSRGDCRCALVPRPRRNISLQITLARELLRGKSAHPCALALFFSLAALL